MQDKKDDLDAEVFGEDDFNFGDEDKMPVAEKKKAEMSELLKKFKASAKEEQRLFQQNIDSEYWVAICFQSREQKEEFLRLAGWLQFGDKYLDGLEVADKMGMKIGHLTQKPRAVKIDKTWKEFV
mgnify:CR=1 FL=1